MSGYQYIRCSVCGEQLEFVRRNELGQDMFKPCIWCKAKTFARGYGKAQEIYKPLHIKFNDMNTTE